MQEHERGELALKFGFNSKKELEIQGYFKPKKEKFSETEVLEAYVSASMTTKEIRKDKVAKALFNEFHKGPDSSQGKKAPKFNVFTWSQVDGPDGPKVDSEKVYHGSRSGNTVKTTHVLSQEVRCACCQSADFIHPAPPSKENTKATFSKVVVPEETVSVFAGKKYKPVGLKVRPVYTELPDKYRIKREIIGDPLKDMPGLKPHPSEYCPTGRYTEERKEIIDKLHTGDFLWPEERKLMHQFMMDQDQAFCYIHATSPVFSSTFR